MSHVTHKHIRQGRAAAGNLCVGGSNLCVIRVCVQVRACAGAGVWLGRVAARRNVPQLTHATQSELLLGFLFFLPATSTHQIELLYRRLESLPHSPCTRKIVMRSFVQDFIRRRGCPGKGCGG